MTRRIAAVALAAAASLAGFAPAASADPIPWPLCVDHPDLISFCLPICFGTHDNWECIPFEDPPWK